MAYESLYRRYRPQRFSQVRGQDHVVAALHNAVRENRVGHAYLLSGPRGTGKTTTARILAKALNCTNLDDGEPCGQCDSCKAIETGTSYDLLELDAASNNGVDAMRDLIAKAALGSPGRTKVYLLDEVHMLSTGASNALLKTLEEPPGHVVFVLATTDPHKVLPTIRSRTQHFELHLLPTDELRTLVDDVIADAGLDVDADAVDYVLRAGGGSARDTLSALDQVVAAGGVIDRGDQVDTLVDALAARDTAVALGEIADAVQRGHDPRVVGEALLARVRDIFLLRMGAPLSHAADRDRTRLEGWAQSLSDRDCTQALEAIGDALRDMRSAPDTRIPLEVALVRLTRPGAGTSIEQLAARVERLERGGAHSEPQRVSAPSLPTTDPDRRMSTSSSARPADAARAALAARGGSEAPTETASTSQQPKAEVPVPPTTSPAPTPPPRMPPEPDAPIEQMTNVPNSGGDLSTDELESVWAEKVLPRLSGLTKAMFSVGHFTSLTADRATFAVPNEVHRNKSAQKLPEVEAAIATQFGHPISIELVVQGQSARNAAPSASTGQTRGTPRRSAAEVDPFDDASSDPIDDIGPIDQLEDAPDDDRSVTQRIVDTFPGAEVVEN